MEDKKKLSNEEIKNEELTDEQANKAAGGFGLNEYKCQGCGREYNDREQSYLNGKSYCGRCYTKLRRSLIFDMEGLIKDPHGRP